MPWDGDGSFDIRPFLSNHPLGKLELYTNCTKIQWCGLNPPALILLYTDLDSST